MNADDDKVLTWAKDEIPQNKIEKNDCYIVDLRYSDDSTINDIMAARRYGSFAVSKDGLKYYEYNTDENT